MTIEQAVKCAMRKLEWQKENGHRMSYSEIDVRRTAEQIYCLTNKYFGGGGDAREPRLDKVTQEIVG